MFKRTSKLKEKLLLITFLLLSAISARANGADSSPGESQRTSVDSMKVIPSGTKIVCVLQTSIDGITSKPGDKISLTVSRLLPDDSTTLRGCKIDGEIFQESTRRKTPNEILLKTDSLIMPDGKSMFIDCLLHRHGGVARIQRGNTEITYDTLSSTTPFFSPYPLSVWPVFAKKGKIISLIVGDQITLELESDLRTDGSGGRPPERKIEKGMLYF